MASSGAWLMSLFHHNEELYVSKELNLAQTKIFLHQREITPTRNDNCSKSICASRPLCMKEATKITFAQLNREKILTGKSSSLARGKSHLLLADPNWIYSNVSKWQITILLTDDRQEGGTAASNGCLYPPPLSLPSPRVFFRSPFPQTESLSSLSALFSQQEKILSCQWVNSSARSFSPPGVETNWWFCLTNSDILNNRRRICVTGMGSSDTLLSFMLL